MSVQQEHYPVIADVSEHDGTYYMEDPDGPAGAWITCYNTMEVRQ